MAFSWESQQQRNEKLLADAKYMKARVESAALPLTLDFAAETLAAADVARFEAVSKDAARIAIESLGSLAKIGELDHLGGGLDLIPAQLMTLAAVDYEAKHFTIEHAHTSIGHYASLAALGFLDPFDVIEGFRRSLDIPGHVSWVPGGTQLNGGRLGVMVPVAVGQSLGLKALHGADAWSICHLGDAGWISGQALNGFNGADLHGAPITFVMHRNGIQLSGSNKQIMDKDPRPIIASLGIEILEIKSVVDFAEMYGAYREAKQKAAAGKPTMIYPTGEQMTIVAMGEKYGIGGAVSEFAAKQGVDASTEIWVPGSLMSYRDVESMLECVFLVNELPGGEGHHDGHMKGRDVAAVVSNPMIAPTADEQSALDELRAAAPRVVVTEARPAPGTANLTLTPEDLASVELPGVGKADSPRTGSQEAYAAIAKRYPNQFFSVGCDLDPSTKFAKAHKQLPPGHMFEMSIEEQAATLMANGLAMSSNAPQLNVVATFAAFYEGIAREGFELWRYQRNLNGVNEGLNVAMHLSHVGSFTGRDHFSGWSLDWISLAIGYLPYVRRFYAPADARAAFVAVRDMAAHYGAHIVCIPRDKLPILAKEGTEDALWSPDSPWEPTTPLRTADGATKAVLALGAPAFLAAEAADRLAADRNEKIDVIVVNGLPFGPSQLEGYLAKYSGGVVTVEDGLIGRSGFDGLRGFAGLVHSANNNSVPMAHVGITDPQVAPSHGWEETWEHFGITADAIVDAVNSL